MVWICFDLVEIKLLSLIEFEDNMAIMTSEIERERKLETQDNENTILFILGSLDPSLRIVVTAYMYRA